MDDHAIKRLRAAFDECLVLLCLEYGRTNRDAFDWLGQLARIQAVLRDHDPEVTQLYVMAKGAAWPARSATTCFCEIFNHVVRAREARFIRMLGVLEDAGILPVPKAQIGDDSDLSLMDEGA